MQVLGSCLTSPLTLCQSADELFNSIITKVELVLVRAVVTQMLMTDYCCLVTLSASRQLKGLMLSAVIAP